MSFNQITIQNTCYGGSGPAYWNSPGATSICPCTNISSGNLPDCDNLGDNLCSVKSNDINYPDCPIGKWYCSPYYWPANNINHKASLCSGADIESCPSLTGIDPQRVKFHGMPDNVLGSTGANIICQYRQSDFKTMEQYNEWIFHNWGNTEAQNQAIHNANHYILPHICLQKASSLSLQSYCPGNYSDCAVLSIKNDPTGYGDLCQNWCQNNRNICDLAIHQYCRREGTSDCACYNRTENRDYNIYAGTAALNNIPPKCWWKPCMSEDNIIPPNMAGNCPNNICPDVIRAVYDNDTVNVNDPNVIDCGQANLSTRTDNFGIALTLIMLLMIILIFALLFLFLSKR